MFAGIISKGVILFRNNKLLSSRLCSPSIRIQYKLCNSRLKNNNCFISTTTSKKSTNPCHDNNIQTRSNNNNNNNTNNIGLFSIPELQVYTDFIKLAQNAIIECNQLRSDIALTVTNPQQLIKSKYDIIILLHQLDDISKIVCNVIDVAELCRNVHSDIKWKNSANDAFIILSDYMSILNADTTLYEALQLISDSIYYNELSHEEQRFTLLLKSEFERDGIHLNDNIRENVREIQHHVTQLETLFSNNIVQCRKNFTVQDASIVTDTIPIHILQHYGYTINTDNGGIKLCNNDPQILQTLLKYSANSDLRKQIYIEFMTSVPENIHVLEELIKYRNELAVMQGFTNFAQRNLIDKMAKSPENVMQFLQIIKKQNENAYKQDIELLSSAKSKVEGNSILQPWDVSFYTGILKARQGDLQSEISQYLTLSSSLDAMKILVNKLFNIEMIEVPLSELERWDIKSNEKSIDNTNQQQQTQLRKFIFNDANGRSLGTMYLDLHPREGKYGHAAHFTVRCGCALDWVLSEDDEPNYQDPVVALVCNLSSESGNNMLSHSEVETLYHEFGHALHSLLSRTKFQHVSGTRGVMDFVETPSHLMEYFVWDRGFLHILTSSSNNGTTTIPDDTITQLQQSRNEFAAIDRQNQILYSLFDQKLHSCPIEQDSTKLFATLHKECNIPYADGTHWHSRFGHLVTYGAGYYGYLYANVFARDIWYHCFEGNSLSYTAGQQLWHKILIHGGAKDPTDMLTDILGRPPKVDFSS